MNNNLLIIGNIWPEPNSSAAGSRMLQLIAVFFKQNYDIIFATTAQESAFMFDLTTIGIKKATIFLNNDNFDHFVAKINPQIVLFDRFMTEEQFGWRIAEQYPNALRVLDTEDLHFLRKARQKSITENKIFQDEDLFSETAKREIASILRCDLTLIISEFEMQLLQEKFEIKSNLLHHLPFLLPAVTKKDISNCPKYFEREDFIFIGNFLHEPNWDAVLYLKKSIWPAIRHLLPKGVLKIYGAYPSQKVLELHSKKEGFHIMGRAESSEDVIKKAKIMLAPIRFGAGIKGKLVEAQRYGTPSITTSIGAESMSENGLWNGFIENDTAKFAEMAVLLYQNETIWSVAQEKGFKIFNSKYKKTNFEIPFVLKIQFLQKNLQKHRTQNFLGAILQHQSLKSTFYMSKWIEEKNKKI